MGSKGRITHLVEMFLNGVSPLIINGFFLIMIVVSLDDVPILFGEVDDFVSSIDLFFDDGTFVGLNSGNDVVDGGGHFGLGEEIKSFLISVGFLEDG
jgi:hypothetical protein